MFKSRTHWSLIRKSWTSFTVSKSAQLWTAAFLLANKDGEPSFAIPFSLPRLEVKAGFLLFWPFLLMSVAQYPHP